MRKLASPSEIGRLAAPVAGLLDAAWQRMHWWIGAMALLYLLSGITIVQVGRSRGDLALGAAGRGHARRCSSTGRACSSPSHGPLTGLCAFR